jgi:ribosomal protein S18 acetylase RimI-like enzyme
VIGSVRVLRIDERTAELGMLSVAPEAFGAGTGRALLRFAEQVYGTDFMQLELLVPRGARHPDKVRLHAWYSRLGYREISRRNFDEPLLAEPADLVTYR